VTRTPRVDPSVGCLEVHEARAKGDSLSGRAVAHAAECPVCRAPVQEEDEGPGGDRADLFAAVRAKVDDERGASAWLRSLATRKRVLGAAAWVALLVTIIGVTLPRGRFAPWPMSRVVLVVSVLAALLALTLRFGLRPLQAAPPPVGLSVACFAAGLLAPFLFALGPFPTRFEGIPGVSFAEATSGCFVLGGVTGALVVLALRALDRGGHRSREPALFAAAAGGLAANAALELHCPATAPAHLLLGHATVALTLVLAYGVLWRQRAR
jgi:hypothetical protein